VDEEPAVRDTLAEALRREGLAVDATAEGRLALEGLVLGCVSPGAK
jgi:DNA-binding response OmpR family regulator